MEYWRSMKIILTGATGLIGSRFEELMFERHALIPLSSQEVNIVDMVSVSNFFEDKKADVVIHFAGKTDVDGCEKDKNLDIGRLNLEDKNPKSFDIESLDNKGWQYKKTAFAINTVGTKNLYEEAKKRGIKFVYVSTDFVFKGNGEYDETSNPDPINWYGMTKWLGERLIDTSKDLIVRLSFPYGYKSPVKKDFVWKLISLLQENSEVSLIEDQTITPTFIDDIINGLDFLLSKNAMGIYHLTGSSSDSPYSIGKKLKDKFGFTTKINSTTRDKIYARKASRPFQSIMKNDKIVRLGFTPKTFDEGFKLIQNS